MICKVCGRNIANEEANFCEYCGASFRPGTDNKITQDVLTNVTSNVYAQSNNGPQGNPNEGAAKSVQQPFSSVPYMTNMNYSKDAKARTSKVPDKTMSFGDWMLSYVLLCIPYVGMVLLFVWAFGAATPPTKKNWARAMLVIMMILVVLMFGVFSSLGGSMLTDPTSVLNSLYAK